MAEKFKLQAVLKYRKTLEEQAQQRLAEFLNAQNLLNQQQDEASSQLNELARQLGQKQRDGLTVLEMRLFEDQIYHHRQQCDKLQIQLVEVDTLINERRQELLVAARERKIIEKLKEKQLAEYLSKLERKERVMLDEISLRKK